jgi:hypothetical protein
VSARAPGPERRRQAAGAVIVTLLLAAALLVRDRNSEEHGNRLFRSGEPGAAADIYGRAAESGRREATIYNLGTALLAVNADSAETVLLSATTAKSTATAQKSFYNLGYRFLIGADLQPDSTAAVLTRAIAAGREALRREPADADARWNLALAQRRLDALIPPKEDVGQESSDDTDDELAMKEASLARSDKPPEQDAPVPDDPRPADTPGTRQGPKEGSHETWATQDPGPMSRAEALELLTTVSDDPETLVRGILWSRRPDIAWWSGQAYPGGKW